MQITSGAYHGYYPGRREGETARTVYRVRSTVGHKCSRATNHSINFERACVIPMQYPWAPVGAFPISGRCIAAKL